MTGEELNRKYWESKGWEFNSISQRWHSYNCRMDLENCGGKLPPLHLDANLAIAEADKLNGHISISTVEDDAECEVKGRHWNVMFESGEFKDWPDVCAANLCEAILKALIAAGGK